MKKKLLVASVVTTLIVAATLSFAALQDDPTSKSGAQAQEQKQQVQKQQIQRTVKQDVKQGTKQNPKQDVKQDTKQDAKQDFKQDTKQDAKQDFKQDTKQDAKQDAKQEPKQNEIVVQRSKTRKYGPNWKVGDSWGVNVTTNQIQGVETKKSKPTKWNFKVEKVVPIRGTQCFQVKASADQNSNDHPIVYLWVDVERGAMKRVTTYAWNGEEWREHTEFYNGADGRATAVVADAATVPIDMPIFPVEGVKDLNGGEIGSGSYDATSVSAALPGVKDVEESAPFSFEVKETVREITPEGSKSIADFEASEYAKALTDEAANEALEVEISIGELGASKQIWTPNAPWPTYSKNGEREAVLVEVHLQD